MIHLSEAIVGINNKPKAIGGVKYFDNLKPGDTIWYWEKGKTYKNKIVELDLKQVKRHNSAEIIRYCDEAGNFKKVAVTEYIRMKCDDSNLGIYTVRIIPGTSNCMMKNTSGYVCWI